MDHDSIQLKLKHEPAMRLLRSDNAAFIISFLHEQFKQAHRITLPYAELLESLENYLDTLHEYHPGLYTRAARAYLDMWCSDEHQILLRYYAEERNDYVLELTPATEKVIGWLEELTKREFVATESRFMHVFDLLQEIIMRSTEDVHTRLSQLEHKKAEIQHEIDTIRRTGIVERFTETQIKERFLEANDTARRLLADFKEVEQNFRDILRVVQEEQLKEDVRKGSVVGYVIDQDEALKTTPQGRSFYTFWTFLRSPAKQSELQALLNNVYALPELHPLTDEHQLLRHIKTSLIDAGEKIVQANHRLAERLRKMLDERNLAENRRALELIAEIKKLALEQSSNPPEDEAFVRVAGNPEIGLIMEQPLWSPGDDPVFNSRDLTHADADVPQDVVTDLVQQFHIDETALEEHVEVLLTEHPQVTLTELIGQYPIRKGLAEVIAYMTIAARKEHHAIDESQHAHLTIEEASDQNGTVARLKLPQVYFRRSARNHE